MAPSGRYHGNCLFAPLNPILSVTSAPQLELGVVGRLKITCGLSLFSSPSASPSLSPSPWGCWVHPPPGPYRPAVLCVVGPGHPGAGFAVEGRQVLGRQLPGQREQGVSEVVAMGTWMLTKAREAVSSHSALLRSPGLVSQAGSQFALGSTGRRVAPSSGSSSAPVLVLQPQASPARPAPGWPPSPAPASRKSTSSSRN